MGAVVDHQHARLVVALLGDGRGWTVVACVATLLLASCPSPPHRDWIQDFAYEGSVPLRRCVVADLDPNRPGAEIGVVDANGAAFLLARVEGGWAVGPLQAAAIPVEPALRLPDDAPFAPRAGSTQGPTSVLAGDDGQVAVRGPEGWTSFAFAPAAVQAMVTLRGGPNPRIATADASGRVLVGELRDSDAPQPREIARDRGPLRSLVVGTLPELGECLVCCGDAGQVLVLVEALRR